MKILVLNSGSSSVKYRLFDMEGERPLAWGLAERIGEESGVLTHRWLSPGGTEHTHRQEGAIEDHRAGMVRIVRLLVDPERGVVRERSEISAVGHRVVHGGETFHAPTVIDEGVLSAIRENIPLAPLHNPHNLTGIEVARALFPQAPQVAVFDTAFHQSLPQRAFLYAIPHELYKKDRVRRYGFHGTSHAYVSEQAAEHLGRPVRDLDVITVHLGNGASMAAVQKGQCVDTSMGLTPLEGLVMGTRCGDLDPALPFFLANHLGMSLQEIEDLLNKESGLKGICGTNDMREVLARSEAGDEKATTALEIYAYRIRKYIGAYFAVLGRLDALVFTAGIGESAPRVRELCCQGLQGLGIEIDAERNRAAGSGVREIQAATSRVAILVIPTNEELRIARETRDLVASLR